MGLRSIVYVFLVHTASIAREQSPKQLTAGKETEDQRHFASVWINKSAH